MVVAAITFSPEWITAGATVLLVVVGLCGLRSLGLAADALDVETRPVIVIEAVESGNDLCDVFFDVQPNERGLPVLKQRTSDEDRNVDLLPHVTLLLRNVGRGAAVGLRLLAHVTIDGTSAVASITLPVVGVGDRDARRAVLRNNSQGRVTVNFYSIAHHQPEDAPGYLHWRGKWAIRLGLGRVAWFQRTRLYAWLVERVEKPHRSVYVYCAEPIVLRAPGKRRLEVWEPLG